MQNARPSPDSSDVSHFVFIWLEGLVGVATGAWENCFFFLSKNVHNREFWLDPFLGLSATENQAT